MENKTTQLELFGTLGPSCAEVSVLKEMIREGMTGMRLNLSHSSLTEAGGLIHNYHEAAAQCSVSPELLIDLQGPTLRIGALEDSIELSDGAVFLLVEDDFMRNDEFLLQPEAPMKGLPMVPAAHHILRAINAGDRVLFDDGAIEAEAVMVGKGKFIGNAEPELSLPTPVDSDAEPLWAQLRVERGGVLKSRKSLKIVDRSVDGPILTAMDALNLQKVREFGVTSVMLPFVRSGKDLRILREAMAGYGCGDLRVFAKIENREGVMHIDDIIPEADMIVIARGDLGNDVPLWELPGVQQDLSEACKRARQPFLVVTQLLYSMIERPVPTRAEMTDIFHAVTSGASALMLTNETAAGNYPAAAMRYLRLAAEAASRRR